MSAWVVITCADREALVHDGPRLTVLASKTDLAGEWGMPEVFTEWGMPDGTPVLRDYRYPNEDGSGRRPDARPCEHYRWNG